MGASLTKSSSLQKKQRFTGFFAYWGFWSSSVRTTRWRTPRSSARRVASSSSRAGYGRRVGPLLRREVAHDPAGERVARAGRVVDGLERIGRHEEERAVRQHEGAVLAALDDDGPRAYRGDRPRRADQVGLARQLTRLGVVDRDHVRLGEDPPERLLLALDPEVHRVERHEAGTGLHLAEDVELELGIDVGEEDEGRTPEPVAERGAEVGEHVELRVEGLRLVQVVAVLPGPAERPPPRRRVAGQIHAAILEESEVRLREVLADRRDEADLGEEARGVREVGRRSTEDVVDLAEGRLDAVERDRADDERGTHAGAPSRGSTGRAGARAASASSAGPPWGSWSRRL